jgi:CheY-like chemotaxis protein
MVGSEVEKGTEVDVSHDPAADKVSEIAQRTILVVEDNRDSREMVRALLLHSTYRYDVKAVETAAEALELDAKRPFDLYVLDIWLPGMDGLGLCRRLRERGRKQPIIFFSAMVQPSDREYVLAAGANEFLVKPKDIDRFIPTVDRLLTSDNKSNA